LGLGLLGLGLLEGLLEGLLWMLGLRLLGLGGLHDGRCTLSILFWASRDPRTILYLRTTGFDDYTGSNTPKGNRDVATHFGRSSGKRRKREAAKRHLNSTPAQDT
jgi:hypothetical protein